VSQDENMDSKRPFSRLAAKERGWSTNKFGNTEKCLWVIPGEMRGLEYVGPFLVIC
jgi:hypothetical protein